MLAAPSDHVVSPDVMPLSPAHSGPVISSGVETGSVSFYRLESNLAPRSLPAIPSWDQVFFSLRASVGFLAICVVVCFLSACSHLMSVTVFVLQEIEHAVCWFLITACRAALSVRTSTVLASWLRRFSCGLVGVVLGDVFSELPEPDPGEQYISLRSKFFWLIPAATKSDACSAYGFRFPLCVEGFTHLAVKDFIAATPEVAVPSHVQGVASVFEGVQEASAHSINVDVECCYC
jgi:hypothetical protein